MLLKHQCHYQQACKLAKRYKNTLNAETIDKKNILEKITAASKFHDKY